MNATWEELRRLGVVQIASERAFAGRRITVTHSSGAVYECHGGVDQEQVFDAIRAWAEKLNAPPVPAGPPPVIDGEVIGFREWRLVDGGLGPRGLQSAPPWTPGVNEATCRAMAVTWGDSAPPIGRHEAPDETCDCGLYALAEPPAPPERPRPGHVVINFSFSMDDAPLVWGAVRAWGERFYLHPTGFRAQYAEPVLLAVSDDMAAEKRAQVRSVAREYGCDVVDLAYLKDAAKEHGQLVPSELLPEADPDEASGFLFTHIMFTANHFARAVKQANEALTRMGKAMNAASTTLSADVEPGPVTRARAKYTDFGGFRDRDRRKLR